jgi:hypothetical protein
MGKLDDFNKKAEGAATELPEDELAGVSGGCARQDDSLLKSKLGSELGDFNPKGGLPGGKPNAIFDDKTFLA